MSISSPRAFRAFCWGTLGYMLGVIAWGAFVRATGSGAGCGDHWPTCNGELLPRAPSQQTLIELIHRLTSGLAGLLVLGQLVWAFVAFPRRHPVRGAVVASMMFLLLEAGLGAGLVLFEWVAHDVSTGRAMAMSVHLVNTFLFLGTLTWVCFHAREGAEPLPRPLRAGQLSWVALALGGVLLTGVSGAVAALGDTLLQVSVPQGAVSLQRSPLLGVLLQLRLLHPVLAVAAAAVVLAAAGRLASLHRPLAGALAALVPVQLGAGVLNVVLKAPVWMQLSHLLIADVMWILLVWLGLHQLALPAEGRMEETPSPARLAS
ncbi:MAG: COX15/CtaA family protein [Myxococcota bacterium]